MNLHQEIQVHIAADGYGLASRVENVTTDRIAIAIPKARSGEEVRLDEGTEVELQWRNRRDHDVQKARARVLGPASLPFPAIDLELCGSDDGNGQRRDNVRVPVWFGLQIWPIVGEDEDEPPPMIGTVFDLSGGGVSARVPSKLEPGSRLWIRFDLGDTGPFETEVCVRRHIMADRYGLSFENQDPRERERVIRFVFGIMREQLRRRAGGEA